MASGTLVGYTLSVNVLTPPAEGWSHLVREILQPVIQDAFDHLTIIN